MTRLRVCCISIVEESATERGYRTYRFARVPTQNGNASSGGRYLMIFELAEPLSQTREFKINQEYHLDLTRVLPNNRRAKVKA